MADYSEDNATFIWISIAARVIYGFFEFAKNIASLDLLKTLYPSKFDFVNGFLQMGYFSGHGVGEYLGIILYEQFGYKVPFLYTTMVILLNVILSFFFLPSCPSISQASPDEEPSEALTQSMLDIRYVILGYIHLIPVWFLFFAGLVLRDHHRHLFKSSFSEQRGQMRTQKS